MKKMVVDQLTRVHYDEANWSTGYKAILAAWDEGAYMDWSLNPFGAGYHAWAAHYNICDVMQKIRRPLDLPEDSTKDAPVYLVGSAYSNDQAWAEGAFCTSESVLVDYFGVIPIISDADYPFICGGASGCR